VQLPAAALKSGSCPYHFYESGRSVFRLTPAMEWFYRKRHPEYESTSGVASGSAVTGPMEFIYPENGSCITIPVQLDGTPGEVILNLAHHDTAATVYWHLDDNYLGETRFIHHLRVRPSPGKHTVTVVDNNGNTLSISITIM
jgi:penicillin-binding protein 1C